MVELTERKTAEYGKFAGDRLSRSSYCYPTEVLLRFCRADTSHFKLLWFRGLHNKKSPKSGASILQRGHQVCCGLKEATHGSHKLPRHELNIHQSGWGIYGFISHQIAATLKKFSNHVWRYYWTRRCHITQFTQLSNHQVSNMRHCMISGASPDCSISILGGEASWPAVVIWRWWDDLPHLFEVMSQPVEQRYNALFSFIFFVRLKKAASLSR